MKREPAGSGYCARCGGLQGYWAHGRSDCVYELRARMRYLAAQNELGTSSGETPERERALARLEERVEDLLGERVAYAPDYPRAA